jgi:hypothetical protein
VNHNPSQHSLDCTRRALDQAFDEINIAALLESHTELAINLTETIKRLERGLRRAPGPNATMTATGIPRSSAALDDDE